MSRPCIASGGGGCQERVRDVGEGEEQVKEEGARLGTSSAVETSTSGEFFGPVPTRLNAWTMKEYMNAMGGDKTIPAL